VKNLFNKNRIILKLNLLKKNYYKILILLNIIIELIISAKIYIKIKRIDFNLIN